MKPILLLLAVFVCGALHAQKAQPKPAPVVPWFLDSLSVTADYIFNPELLGEMNVKKDDPQYPNGVIYMKSKQPGTVYHFVSLDSIALENSVAKGAPVLFMLNDAVVKNSDRVKIDSSFILSVTVTKAEEIASLKRKVPSFAIVTIKTRTKQNVEAAAKPMIRLRGADTPAM